MVEISPDLQRYIKKLDEEEVRLRGAGGNEIDDETFQRLLSLGVVIPSVYAFSFDGKAVLLAGKVGRGASSVFDKFVRLYPDRARILSENNPTVYQQQTGNKPVVYYDDTHSQEYPFFVPFLYPGSAEEFPLEYIFHLRPSSGLKIIREGSKASAIGSMVFWLETRESSRRLNAMFAQVKCYEVLEPSWYGIDPSKQDAFSQRFSASADQNLEKIVAEMAGRMTTL